jgi:CheY-like chemotaxis protein
VSSPARPAPRARAARDTDGYEFARQFRALTSSRRIRLVALSGYARPEDVSRAMEAGFDAHVAKPVDPPEIERLLSQEAPAAI